MSDGLDALWDFADPVASERRFRDVVATSGPDRLAATTQVARALGLQERFDEAHALLDTLDGSPDLSPETRVRSALERGRLRRSAGDPAAARVHFQAAAVSAQEAGLERLHVDALHMLALDLPPSESVAAHLAALDVARAARDPGARAWEPSLLNNLGMAHHDAGDLPQALARFEEALAVTSRDGSEKDVRVARWMVGWTLRLLGRDVEAMVLQQALRVELEAAGEVDPYVDEEIALLSGGGTSGR